MLFEEELSKYVNLLYFDHYYKQKCLYLYYKLVFKYSCGNMIVRQK